MKEMTESVVMCDIGFMFWIATGTSQTIHRGGAIISQMKQEGDIFCYTLTDASVVFWNSLVAG